jgi:hypothetical protein
LTEAVQRASLFNPKVAKEVGMGALKYNDLRRECSKDIVFVWDEVPNYNQELRNKGVKLIVDKDYNKLDEFANKVIQTIESQLGS